jgi:protein SCO1
VRLSATAAKSVIAAALLLLAGCAGTPPPQAVAPGGDGSITDATLRGTLVRDWQLPDVTLTDTTGNQYNLRRDSTRPVTVLFFGFTHCPDECPTTAADITVALRALDPVDRRKVQVLFVSADPARDTPARIRRWLDRFDPAYEGLTGPKRRIRAVAARIGVALGGKTATGGSTPRQYDVDHGLQVFAFIDANDSAVLWNGAPLVRDMAADLSILTR